MRRSPMLPIPVLPPHVGTPPALVEQPHLARIKLALELLSSVFCELETAPVFVREAATLALATVLELSAALEATRQR